MSESIKKRVQKAIDQIRPELQADGGDVELVGIEGSTVKVRLTGACGGCPMATMTLKQGVESIIKKLVPEITSVEAAQPVGHDHSADRYVR